MLSKPKIMFECPLIWTTVKQIVVVDYRMLTSALLNRCQKVLDAKLLTLRRTKSSRCAIWKSSSVLRLYELRQLLLDPRRKVLAAYAWTTGISTQLQFDIWRNPMEGLGHIFSWTRDHIFYTGYQERLFQAHIAGERRETLVCDNSWIVSNYL